MDVLGYYKAEIVPKLYVVVLSNVIDLFVDNMAAPKTL